MERKKIRRLLRHISVGAAWGIVLFCLCAVERVTWWVPVALILSAGWLALYYRANPCRERSK